ncbi:MAG: hypothetical protein K2Y40_04900 [Reyranella sp.]|nr:hypothetical protein [Reyranella sp.]
MFFRALGWLLLAMAVAAVVHDGLAWWTEGTLRLLSLGGLWSHLDAGSLGAVQGGLAGPLWSWAGRPLLMIPAVAAFVVLGAACLWFGSRAAQPAETGFFIGARPPRRRRSRGLS